MNKLSLRQLQEKEAMERSGVTQKQLEEWMDKYGDDKVYAIEVPIDETYRDYVLGVVYDPPTPVLNNYLRKAERVPVEAAEVLVRSCWLGGYEQIQTDRGLLMSFVGQLSEKLVGGQARIKKLTRTTQN
jgi:hypothetical protein